MNSIGRDQVRISVEIADGDRRKTREFAGNGLKRQDRRDQVGGELGTYRQRPRSGPPRIHPLRGHPHRREDHHCPGRRHHSERGVGLSHRRARRVPQTPAPEAIPSACRARPTRSGNSSRRAREPSPSPANRAPAKQLRPGGLARTRWPRTPKAESGPRDSQALACTNARIAAKAVTLDCRSERGGTGGCGAVPSNATPDASLSVAKQAANRCRSEQTENDPISTSTHSRAARSTPCRRCTNDTASQNYFA